MDLNGQKILVTGASRGIGNAVSTFLLRQGAEVALHYHTGETTAKTLAQQFDKAKTFQADLSISDEVIKLFQEVVVQFGTLNTIILNAGVFLPHSIDGLAEDWLAVWKRTMAINLDAVGLLTKLGIDHFKKREGGRFIYIGSRSAFRGETGDYLGYAASKGGLTSLAKTVARSFGKDNIKSFVVAPGFTRTEMAEPFIKEYGEERILDEIALNALTTPNDIAPLVGLMSSGQMDHATGATIDMNAGSHIR